mmetsp:Transcript_20032/g.66664  ORF Transcript_20032/g.66664 Transcript_20032/m.66664 type:complete len:236 (+) Transcript_20032:3133-3840(+)
MAFETTIWRASSTGSEGMVWHGRLIPLSVVGVLDGERNDLISNNVVASLTLGGDAISSVNRVILDLEAQMVVQDICVGALRRFLGTIFRSKLATNGIAKIVNLHGLVGLVLISEVDHLSHREVVQSHVHTVLKNGKILKLFHLLGGVGLAAEDFAILIHAHTRLVSGGVSLLASQSLSEVLRQILDPPWLAERKLIVVELQRSLSAHQSLNLHLDRLAIFECSWCNTRQVKGLRR